MTDEDDDGDIKIMRARDFLKEYKEKYGCIKFGYVLGNNGSKRFFEDGVSPCEIMRKGGKIAYIGGGNGVPVKAALVLDKNKNPFWYFEARSYGGAGIFFTADGDGSVAMEGDKYLGRLRAFLEKKKIWKAKSGGKRD
ncbi:MAG: hypothetical protein WA139_00720 [Candidatus Aenigmatarchaeota archaeon]